MCPQQWTEICFWCILWVSWIEVRVLTTFIRSQHDPEFGLLRSRWWDEKSQGFLREHSQEPIVQAKNYSGDRNSICIQFRKASVWEINEHHSVSIPGSDDQTLSIMYTLMENSIECAFAFYLFSDDIILYLLVPLHVLFKNCALFTQWEEEHQCSHTPLLTPLLVLIHFPHYDFDDYYSKYFFIPFSQFLVYFKVRYFKLK